MWLRLKEEKQYLHSWGKCWVQKLENKVGGEDKGLSIHISTYHMWSWETIGYNVKHQSGRLINMNSQGW